MNPEHILIGESEATRHLRDMIATVAPSRIPVLIEGPTGSGKELVAALLHQLSKRDGEFVPFNVCALGDSMFEDALFGHVRGAFTGAAGESLGFLREANGGTVFVHSVSIQRVWTRNGSSTKDGSRTISRWNGRAVAMPAAENRSARLSSGMTTGLTPGPIARHALGAAG